MAYEVELKAHVHDQAKLKCRLDALNGISAPLCEIKEDVYYCVPGEDALFRLRRESIGPSFSALDGQIVFTKKLKTLKDGIEVNQELEFTASDSQFDQAHAFCLALGYEVYIRKTKRGYAYSCPVSTDLPFLHIELVEVPPLGWFLEMEFVLEEEKKVPEARTFLMEMLYRLGLGQADIESRYYMHLLKAQSTG
ncbi:MAG: CYTH domain-containing protein [Spirochaetales bacterium]|jgi:adenylate cyclase class 2|nr:CYTH domain-containing protein [Spirochaetales bacterium]